MEFHEFEEILKNNGGKMKTMAIVTEEDKFKGVIIQVVTDRVFTDNDRVKICVNGKDTEVLMCNIISAEFVK